MNPATARKEQAVETVMAHLDAVETALQRVKEWAHMMYEVSTKEDQP